MSNKDRKASLTIKAAKPNRMIAVPLCTHIKIFGLGKRPTIASNVVKNTTHINTPDKNIKMIPKREIGSGTLKSLYKINVPIDTHQR